ncbi:MAG TPA: SGNH/GDSL hydrolase family protein [Acidobacteriaceae bacterium]|nr:SGNH/GDSL hydrolase family protein [Acidobacteriaceae bacterium]
MSAPTLNSRCLAFLISSALLLPASLVAHAQMPHPQWVGTWAASPMPVENGSSRIPLSDTTLREIAHVSIGGSVVRVRFTNRYGTDPLTIRDAHIALSAGESSIQKETDHALTFDGSDTVRIPAGAVMYSDPVHLDVPALSNVAVSFYVPSQNMRSETFHDLANQNNYVTHGDVPGSTVLSQAKVLPSWYFFDGVDVQTVGGSRAIVALGDSITDGWQSTPNENRRWPDDLAVRLNHTPGLEHVGVLNEGISGNRVLNDGWGPSAMKRFDSDVLAQSDVRYLIILESINDIGALHDLRNPDDAVTAAQLELGLKQMAEQAREHGIKVIGATLTPYQGADYYSTEGEQVREAVNDWIRTSGTFDAVVDFDKVTRDPEDPKRFDPKYDSGDHLHPNDAGYQAMADAIDLKAFGLRTR